MSNNPFAVVIGAASGSGYQLARCCAEQGFDLLVTSDSPDIEDAAQALREMGVSVDSVMADSSSLQGVEEIHQAIAGRPVDALLINACAGRNQHLGADPGVMRHLVDAHITGILYLLHKIGSGIRAQGNGRILVTGSLRGFVPAFVDSFALGLRSQLKDGGVTVTCLIPGAKQAGLFSRTDGLNTQVIYAEQDDPTAVATAGFEAMMRGEEGADGEWSRAIPMRSLQSLPASVMTHQYQRAVMNS